MKRYRVIGAAVNFASGVLQLTDEQYKARKHALDPLGKDDYLILSTVQFKRGEEVGYDGDVSKSLLCDIEEGKKSTKKKGDPLLSILDKNAQDVGKTLEEGKLTKVQLEKLLVAEEGGKKPRKTVVEAIKKAVATLDASTEE